MIRFASWWFLFCIPVVAGLFFFAGKKKGLTFSSVALLKRAGQPKTAKHKIGKALVLCGLLLSLIALARPQTSEKAENIRRQGIDIAILLDVSGTMQSADLEPNRLEVARKTIDDFIAERAGDRLSLIIFAGSAFTRIPLTLDHNVVRESLAGITFESVDQDGTAIGMAVSVALNRLKKSDAASRVIILVTDGDNNAGAIDPLTAGTLAQELGIRIYPIGIGSDSLLLPVQSFGQTRYRQYQGGFDEALLRRMADMTGGQYFRAMDARALSQVFETINQLEKTEFQEDLYQQYHELAFPFIMAALALLAAGIILDKYCFVQVP